MGARDVKTLHAAAQWFALQESKALTNKKVETVKPVTVRTARSTPETQASTALAEQKARAAKTGKASDTEAYLAALFERSGKARKR